MSQYPTSPQHGQGQSNEGSTGLAVAALVCGIIGFCVVPAGIAGLIMGIMFLSKTRDSHPGRGMALAGVITGALGLVSGVLIMIAILLPAIGAANRTAERMQNSTQLRGIHMGLVTFANSNKNRFPGLTSSGDILADSAQTGNSGDGNTPQACFWFLLDGNYITPEYAISPSETEPMALYPGSGPVTADHYSYATLEFGKTGSVNTDSRSGIQSYYPGSASAGRASEWSQTLNSQAVVLSDRNTGINGTNAVDSIHSGSPGSWRGSVLWNDNHVAFDTTQYFETKYGSGSLNPNDNLFEDDGTGGYDAIMVHE